MTTSLFANPGQTITLAVQILDSDDSRVDGYQDGYQGPTIDFIRLPSGSNASGYPMEMTRIDTGLYIHSLILPSGTSGVGTYIVSASWNHPDTEAEQYELFIITVAMPFGNSSVFPA